MKVNQIGSRGGELG